MSHAITDMIRDFNNYISDTNKSIKKTFSFTVDEKPVGPYILGVFTIGVIGAMLYRSNGTGAVMDVVEEPDNDNTENDESEEPLIYNDEPPSDYNDEPPSEAINEEIPQEDISENVASETPDSDEQPMLQSEELKNREEQPPEQIDEQPAQPQQQEQKEQQKEKTDEERMMEQLLG